MELSISKKDLLRGLERTHTVADRKSSMPILSNVLMTADDSGIVRLSATDLFLAVSTSAAGHVKRAGSVAISARTLFDIVKNLPEGEVKLVVDKNQAVQLRSGKIKYRIPGMPGEDFPVLPSVQDTSLSDVKAELLLDLVQLTQYAMSTDDTRPHLAATLFESDGALLRMVTTDGHRLAKAEHRVSGISAFSMLLPGKGIAELKRLIENVRSDRQRAADEPAVLGVGANGSFAFFRGPDVLLSIKLVQEQFPPYSKVIPAACQRKVVMARDLLQSALRRISLVASDKSGGVRMILSEGKVEIVSENPDVGEGSEELDVDYVGEKLSIGFNARYVLDVLGALSDDEVALELSGELDPAVIKPLSEVPFVGVIMPMRI